MAKKSLCKSGKILRLIRRENLMSQSELAFKLELTPGYLALIEKGTNTLPPGLIIPMLKLAKEANLEIDIMEILHNYYEEFKTQITRVQAGGSLIKDRLDKIESEVLQMKSGNVYVRTKK